MFHSLWIRIQRADGTTTSRITRFCYRSIKTSGTSWHFYVKRKRSSRYPRATPPLRRVTGRGHTHFCRTDGHEYKLWSNPPPSFSLWHRNFKNLTLPLDLGCFKDILIFKIHSEKSRTETREGFWIRDTEALTVQKQINITITVFCFFAESIRFFSSDHLIFILF